MDDKKMKELKPEEMEKISGGAPKTIVTGSATVRTGASLNHPVSRILAYNTVVNFTGKISYNDSEGTFWYNISSPVSGWVLGVDIGIEV